MDDATRVIRAGVSAARAGQPVHAGPVFVSPFHLKGNASGEGYTYGRSSNPGWTELEAAIAGLEGPRCAGVRVFASGVAAMAAVFGAVLRPGDVVAAPAAGYFGSRALLQGMFEPMGVQVRLLPAAELVTPGGVQRAKLVWVETPSNPRMEITDLSRAVEVAHGAGALLAVDNTTATPMGMKPLEFGADFSVCSDSKAMGGHSDLVLGHVAAADADWLGKIDRERNMRGAIVGPMEAWLALRSLATLPLRLERSSGNALAIAEMLAGCDGVSEVVYPGLKTHPGHAVAAAQMRYFGPVLGFSLGSKEAAERFLARAELVTEATSFGGISTSAERRARWGADDIPVGFVRLSAGCEDVQDLLADLRQALL